MSFSKPQVGFSSNFASLSSVMKHNSSVLFYLKQKKSIKVQIFRLSSARIKIHQILYVNFETTSQLLFKFCIILHSSVNFKLIHFLLWIKESHQSPNFKTFECSGKNLPNSSYHFPNHKSVFLQILHHSSVS